MKKDLMVVVADKDMEYTLKGLLANPRKLGIRSIEADIQPHPQRDPGCAHRGVEFLSSFSKQYCYGLLMFDYEGSGREDCHPSELQNSLDREFAAPPWEGRARVIVLSPELEAWVWADSPHVDDVAGWKNRQPPLRRWLMDRGLLEQGKSKPARPKEAFEAALYETKTPRSAILYRQIAEKVSLRRCTDKAFQDFQSVLRGWFPADSAP